MGKFGGEITGTKSNNCIQFPITETEQQVRTK